MPRIPRETAPDSTPALLREGYCFIARRCQAHDSAIFRTRIMLEDTLCLRGAEAAQLFYNTDYCKREGAAPARIRKTLFGVGGVQGLDDNAHRHRKAMFLSLMTEAGIERLVAIAGTHWQQAVQRWEGMHEVVLHDECQALLCRAVCEWAGVPLEEHEVRLRTTQLAAMIEGAGRLGPAHWQARHHRRRAERWVGELIDAVRHQRLAVAADSALATVAFYRDEHNEPLTLHTAAVELLNILRPTLAVARYIVFEALALHEHPTMRPAPNDDAALERFVQEVRRFYPFFPLAAARTRRACEWQGYILPGDTRLLLDLYGTNHDPACWQAPETFDPERFRNRSINAFELIPQGGGRHDIHHRCPGEWITIALMKAAADWLQAIDHAVPEQDLRVPLDRMPTLPRSGFRIRQVRRRRTSA